jgi:AcrR family transcriptional regulator
MLVYDPEQLQTHILQMEQAGLVTRTFRRLDAARQLAIIQATLEEAVASGPSQLNIKQVAERAGVAVGSLYQYFENRDGLLAFISDLCVRLMTDMFALARPYLLAMPLRDALQAYVGGGLEWGEAQAELLRFFARAAYHSDSELSEQVVRPIADTMRQLAHDLLAQAVERGEVRPDIDLNSTARLIHAWSIAAGDSQLLPYLNTYFQVTGDGVTPERCFDAFIALILQGIGPPTP